MEAVLFDLRWSTYLIFIGFGDLQRAAVLAALSLVFTDIYRLLFSSLNTFLTTLLRRVADVNKTAKTWCFNDKHEFLLAIA